MGDVFWIDGHDRDAASDGESRYGSYVQQERFEPETGDCQAAELAEFAWRRGTSPVMAPGYVLMHPRVRHARLWHSDGSLAAAVDLVIPQPKQLRNLPSGDDRNFWRDWQHSRYGGTEAYYEPGDEDLAGSQYLLCTASLRFTVPSAYLISPPPSPSGRLLTDACKRSVAAMVTTLNQITSPILNRIEET